MKQMLMAGVAVVALMGPANSQIPVTDTASIGMQVTNWARQAADMGHELAQLKETFRVNVGILGSLLRTIDPNNIARQIGSLNPLGDVTNLTGGLTGIQGITGMVNGRGLNMQSVVNSFMHGNSYYSPQPWSTPGDFTAPWIERNLSSTSHLQAMATQMLSDSQNRLSGIEELQAELSNVQSDADLSAIRGKIDAQNAALTAQNLQMSSVTAMWQAQREALAQQREQAQRKSADALGEQAEGGGTQIGGGLVATQPPPAMPAAFSSIPGG